jgi:hypothetical protein
VPAHLASRAFSRAEAIDAGITPRMLQHPRFVQVHPSVYRLDGVRLDEHGRIAAARLALPSDARVSHGTRLRLLGVERGSLLPIHFTVARDLHLDLTDVMLHRTAVMPPHDDECVSVEAAFIGYIASARLIDRVVIGDWLLHHGHTSIARLLDLASRQEWRPGVAELRQLVPLLEDRSRSIPESEVRICLQMAGLPLPEVNADVHDESGSFIACGDLVYRLWKLLIEYEGGQHFTDADQIASDVDRYARVRRDGWSYVQVTGRHLRAPTSMVRRVHRELVACGYDGPPPVFGPRWDELFRQPKLRARRPKEVDRQPSDASHGCASTSSEATTS